jgi:hypothetical protein
MHDILVNSDTVEDHEKDLALVLKKLKEEGISISF